MRKFISILRAGLKYGGLILVIVDVVGYAIDKFEEYADKSGKDKEPKTE